MFNSIQPNQKERIQKATWLLKQLGCSSSEYADLVKEFQLSYGLAPDRILGRKTYEKLFAALIPIKRSKVSYAKTPMPRFTTAKRVCLHYTCAHNVDGSIAHWNTKSFAGGTPFVIDRQGNLYIVFDYRSGYSYHMGLKTESAYLRDNFECATLGIELCNAGYTSKKNGLWVNPLGVVSDDANVVQINPPHRKNMYYEEYTDAQILTLTRLVVLLSLEFEFDISRLNMDTMFDYDPKWNINNRNGIITHCTVRQDKFDLAPTPKVVEFFNSLKSILAGG